MTSLVFYEYDTAEVLTGFDYGPVAPGSSDDLTLTLLNQSTTYQANNVLLSLSGDDDQLLLSADGDAFAATLDVGTIGPNSTCAPFVVRRVTAFTAADGAVFSAQLLATPEFWSPVVDPTVSDNIGLDSEVVTAQQLSALYDAPVPPDN